MPPQHESAQVLGPALRIRPNAGYLVFGRRFEPNRAMTGMDQKAGFEILGREDSLR